MNKSLRETAVVDLVYDLRRLSTLAREFLHEWRCALGLMRSTPQLAQVSDWVQCLAGLEAQAQLDEDAAIPAALDRVELDCHAHEVGDRLAEDLPGPAAEMDAACHALRTTTDATGRTPDAALDSLD